MKQLNLNNFKTVTDEFFIVPFLKIVILDTNVIEDLCSDITPKWFDVFIEMKKAGWHFCMSNLAYNEIKQHLSEYLVNIENSINFLHNASKILSPEFPIFPKPGHIINLFDNKNKNLRVARLRKISRLQWSKISSQEIKSTHELSTSAIIDDISDDEDSCKLREASINLDNFSSELNRKFDDFSEALNYECKHLSNERDYIKTFHYLNDALEQWNTSFEVIKNIKRGRKASKAKIKLFAWEFLKSRIRTHENIHPSLRFRLDLMLSVYSDLWIRSANGKYDHTAKKRKNDGKDIELIWNSINCCIVCTNDANLNKLVQRQNRPQSILFLKANEIQKLYEFSKK